ncbi:hypothetical protein FB567DRAFT_628101 [Paraphoma chrysanthemicola]|uniref:Fungal N-terminal domain-containing protein n=1 Tax=Paraphoma chrysanthemicola TaxID=798071 RepID=A0A8K0R7E8_9PLEO|nr:hypothetical protein FB567DRAFT_628101 [Paraphoma chrysanthemicola]
MCEPFSLGAIFASVGSAFKFADLAVRVAEVGSENEVFVRTIRVVRDDLNEVERLLSNDSVHRKVTGIPGKLPWIKGAIINTKSALNEIGKWVEHARAEQESTGSIRFETRIRWVFNDHEKLLNRKTELSTCHQQLSNVLTYLLRLEDVPTTAEPPEYIEATFFDDILSRHKRKTVASASDGRNRLEQPYNSVAPSFTVAEKAPSIQRRPVSAQFHADGAKPQNINQENTETWLNEPPCSPPPTYTSVIARSASADQQHSSAANSCALEPFSFASTDDKKQLSSANKAVEKGEGSHGIWAYEYSHGGAVFVPELAGDTVFMSGTNSMGPVNPFEFGPEPSKQAYPIVSKSEDPGRVVEMLGSLNFAVELPVNDPGPPPGYPPRSKEVKTMNMAGIQPARMSYPKNHSASAVELPAMVMGRPSIHHATTEPGRNSQGFRHSVGREAYVATLPQVPTTTALPRERSSLFELPSSSAHESHEMPQSHASQIITYSTPRNSSHTPSLRHSMAATSPDHLQSAVRANSDAHHQSDGTHTGTPGTRLPPRGLIATGRMRRQKDMMDLLGSLE